MKKEAINQLFNTAQFYHTDLMTHISNLVQGGDLEAVSQHVAKTDCQFGKWLYTDAITFKKFLSYNKVEHYHNNLHDSLLKLILQIKKKIPNNIFNRKKKKKQQEYIQVYYQQIQNASFDMLKALNNLENEVLNFEISNTNSLFANYNIPSEDNSTNKKAKTGKKKMTKEEREDIKEGIKRIFGEI